MIHLIVQRQTVVVLSRRLLSTPVLIGRSDTADIPLPDGTVNAVHARLERRRRDWWIVPQPDAAVYLNARIIMRPTLMRVNDIVNIGEYSLYLSTETNVNMVRTLLVKNRFFWKNYWRWPFLLSVVMLAVWGVFQPDHEACHSHTCPMSRYHNHSHEHPSTEALTNPPAAAGVLRKVRRLKAEGDLDSLFAAKQLLGQLLFRAKPDSLLLAEFIEIDQHLYQQMKVSPARGLSASMPKSTGTAAITKQRIVAPAAGEDSAKPENSNVFSNDGNQPPVVRDFWLLRDAVLLGTRTPAVILASDPDGDSLVFEWHAFYGTIIGQGANVLYETPEKLPPFSEDLVTVTVSDKKNPAQQFFKSIQVLDSFPIVSEQKLVAREFYNLALVYEVHYQDLEKAEEYLKKVMFVAPDTTFLFYRYAKKRLEEISNSKKMNNIHSF